KKLNEHGLNPWLDKESLTPGVIWEEKTEEAIKNARFFLACLSRKSVNKKGYFQKELRMALREFEKKPSGTSYFIPVLIEDIELLDIAVGKVHLKDFHAVKITDEKGFQKLITLIKKEGLKQEVIHCISEDQTDTALNVLKDYARNNASKWENEIILFSSRYHNLEKQDRRGTLDRTQYLIEKNKITHSILELLQRLN
ncbi:MAG: TIR domain-containing protein, partial [Bacteroidota bacterium]